MIARHRGELVDAPIIGAFGRFETTALQARARMIGCVRFERETFFEPSRKLRVFRVDAVGQNAGRRAPINLFESFEDWT